MHAYDKIEIPLSLEEANVVLDELTYLLTSIGINNDSSINESGGEIEKYIDVFSKFVYED